MHELGVVFYVIDDVLATGGTLTACKDLIKQEQLAKPKLCILHNLANEEMDEEIVDYNWHNVRKIRQQSKYRTNLIAKAAVTFAKRGYKVIILMNL